MDSQTYLSHHNLVPFCKICKSQSTKFDPSIGDFSDLCEDCMGICYTPAISPVTLTSTLGSAVISQPNFGVHDHTHLQPMGFSGPSMGTSQFDAMGNFSIPVFSGHPPFGDNMYHDVHAFSQHSRGSNHSGPMDMPYSTWTGTADSMTVQQLVVTDTGSQSFAEPTQGFSEPTQSFPESTQSLLGPIKNVSVPIQSASEPANSTPELAQSTSEPTQSTSEQGHETQNPQTTSSGSEVGTSSSSRSSSSGPRQVTPDSCESCRKNHVKCEKGADGACGRCVKKNIKCTTTGSDKRTSRTNMEELQHIVNEYRALSTTLLSALKLLGRRSLLVNTTTTAIAAPLTSSQAYGGRDIPEEHLEWAGNALNVYLENDLSADPVRVETFPTLDGHSRRAGRLKDIRDRKKEASESGLELTGGIYYLWVSTVSGNLAPDIIGAYIQAAENGSFDPAYLNRSDLQHLGCMVRDKSILKKASGSSSTGLPHE